MTAARTAAVMGLAALIAAAGCSRAQKHEDPANEVSWDAAAPAKSLGMGSQPVSPAATASTTNNLGFDRNDYPGDAIMANMRGQFGFTGYWLTPPPGAKTNSWKGKRTLLENQGWGFLVLANGRLDAEILKAQKAGTKPEELGRKDAAVAVAAAKAEGFPAGAILFLDQEEGGRLLDEQAAYLLAWTEGVAATAYKPGVYASGQLVEDAPGVKIDTIQDIRARVKQGKLHEIAMFDAQDACPPAPGCTATAKPLSAAGEPNLIAWQYAQSPRRPEITQSCGKTYAADGNCYAPGFPTVFLDRNIAISSDPSHGR